MNKKDEIKIEVLSNIDDDIIEKQSSKRYRLTLKNRYSRKKLTGWVSVAASLILIASLLIPFWIFNRGHQVPIDEETTSVDERQVPVYEGMTVSNVMPTVQAKKNDASKPLLVRTMKGNPTALVKMLLTHSDTLPPLQDDTQPQDETTTFLEEDRRLYYANKNEDIYIEIHLNNPEQFEILSFTLNGIKYQSYMFEDGSNSELLILKVNVGDVQGIIEYTIDAIKYIDGTTTKDVRMEGDRTVKVGVYPKDQPTVRLDKLQVGTEALSFEATLSDPLSLIPEFSGTLVAELYDGDRCISTEQLSLDEVSSATFSGLTPGKSYTLRIVANYDALDGDGFGAYPLYEYDFFTESLIEIVNARLEHETDLSFDLVPTEGKAVSISKIELMNGDVVERTGDESTRSFTGLSFGTYGVVVTYTYGENGAKTGYARTFDENLVISTLGRIGDVVKNANISKEYSGKLQIYYPTIHDYGLHTAIDLVPGGTNQGVYSTVTAIVTQASDDTVVLSTLDGRIKIRYRSLGEILVAQGDTVAIGQQIGTVGNTYDKEASEAAHVHLEVEVSNNMVDPLDYFKQ